MKKPIYNSKPISTLDALSKALGINLSQLQKFIDTAEHSYTTFTLEKKVNGIVVKERILNEPKKNLKDLQKRINQVIFSNVSYPEYLQGGIKGKDFITNSKNHLSAKSLINLDIKDFYPSISIHHVYPIYNKLFKFPHTVSDALVKLTTKNGVVTQGGCCSSYIANLIFFNSEHNLVQKLESRGLTYTRLIDDITISSAKPMSKDEITSSISMVSNHLTKFNLNLNKDKTNIDHHHNKNDNFEVTGLWVRHGKPKIKSTIRRQIRQLVLKCKAQYELCPTSKSYHDLWNKTSGKVAILTRLGHANSKVYRKKLSEVLPLYDVKKQEKIERIVNYLVDVKNEEINSPRKIKLYHRMIYHCGILGRNNKSKAKILKNKLKAKFMTAQI